MPPASPRVHRVLDIIVSRCLRECQGKPARRRAEDFGKRGPEERLRSDSVTGPFCPKSSARLLVRPRKGETGRPFGTGPVTESLHSHNSGAGSEGRPVSPHLAITG